MKFGITGASSDIGRNLHSLLKSRGHQVLTFGRREENYWELGREFPKSEIEVLFHLAHDRRLTLVENERAADLLVSSFTKKIVYISSTSAHPNSISRYGKSKYLFQEIIQKSGGVVVIAGIIFGDTCISSKSVLAKMNDAVNSLPFILVPFFGKPRLYFSEVRALSEALYIAAKEQETGAIRAFSNSSHSLYELLRIIASKNERHPKTIRLPNIGASKFLEFTSKFIDYPDPIDSLLSLVHEMPMDYLHQLKEIPGLEFPVY